MDEDYDLLKKAAAPVIVFYNGLVQYLSGFRWKTSCELNLKYFPFDKQVSDSSVFYLYLTTLHIY